MGRILSSGYPVFHTFVTGYLYALGLEIGETYFSGNGIFTCNGYFPVYLWFSFDDTFVGSGSSTTLAVDTGIVSGHFSSGGNAIFLHVIKKIIKIIVD